MRSAVLRLVLLAAAVVLPALPMTALAFDGKKPEATSPIYIAMTYLKFASKEHPDFSQWVQQTPEYMSAELWQRPDIIEKNSQELEDTYNLLTGLEPIVVSMRTRISGYSKMGHGFLVQSFDNRDYFNYEYLGRHYAVIPKGIDAYQWMKAPATDAPEIMRETDNGHNASMVITLTPIAADPNPMNMGGKKYHLLMAEVSKIELWSKDGARIVWDDKMNAPHSVQSRLRDLYQH